MRQSVGTGALLQKAIYFPMSFNNQPQMFHPGCSGGSTRPAALLHWCWWRSHVEAACVCLVCEEGLWLPCLREHPPPPPSSSESNPTSLPVDVESDGNIFCSQNVAVVAVVCCFVLFLAFPWFRLYWERKSVLEKEGGYRNKSHSSGKKPLV